MTARPAARRLLTDLVGVLLPWPKPVSFLSCCASGWLYPEVATVDIPAGWTLKNGQPEPSPEEIDRLAAEIRSTWSDQEHEVRYWRARGIKQEEIDSVNGPRIHEMPDYTDDNPRSG